VERNGVAEDAANKTALSQLIYNLEDGGSFSPND
jgi:hypothetical protein